MPKLKVITISGVPGSGTTTIANMLSKELNLKFIYTGETFRELAKEYKMSLPEFSEFAEANSEIDNELDKRQLEHARAGDIILEGRLAGWLTKSNNINALKVLLTADLETRVSRIMGREKKSHSQVKSEILKRETSELERYQRLYGVNYKDQAHYDLVIDTTNLTPREIVGKIISALKMEN
jgi:cytidylate kinase